MKLKELIEEVYNQGPKSYPAYSSAPRKDFVPHSTKDGYNFPYQKNAPPIFPPEPPQPANPVALPWPLQTINDDLSDAYIYLLGAAKKISDVVANNPTINTDQKTEFMGLYKDLKTALDHIKKVGLKVSDIGNMALPTPSQSSVTPIPVKPEHPFI
jgi:hypothetical protein